MTTNGCATILALLLMFGVSAAEETRLQGPETPPSPLENLFWSVLPILIIAGFIWFFFSRVLRKSQKRSEDYMGAVLQHNERVERLLERIAAGLPGTATMADRAACTECGGVFNVQDMIRYEGRYVCAKCKPILFQKLAEGMKLGTGAKP